MSLRERGSWRRAAWRLRVAVALMMCWFAGTGVSWAGGPRWVTGPPYFTTSGNYVVWYTNQLSYFTDPGDLSSNVNHAAADALVAAAANVWNVPTANLSVAQGGALSEHVSGANTFLGPSGLIFPADVQSSNYLNKQIAVIYDRDGSVTDLLLGNGASDPTGCLQNGVTESVDSIVPTGQIEHALLILNGRCTGPAPEQQMQMQYQLMRAFGRILGLGWSQTNDNVFTASPVATFNQAMHWPVMHPIDIICGLYTYQCMPQPFTLRPDDLSALGQLYPIGQGMASPGKTDTLYNASQFQGRIFFSGGQGMQGVNVVGRRWAQFTAPSQAETWQTASSVTGALYRQSNGNPVTGGDTTMLGTMGTTNNFFEGFFDLARVPLLPGTWQLIILETEPINPLYTGQYSIGPYTATVQPSGSNLSSVQGLFATYQQSFTDFYIADSASSCSSGSDGVEGAPAAVAASGWWTGLLCGYGHVSWASVAVKGNRSLTLEVTAEDEQGSATIAKALPVIGVWNSTDTLGTLPGVASASEPFNGATTGTTTLTTSITQPKQLRIAIADQRGDGRPDYNYQARVLYADAVSPSSISASGGVIAITGMGFRTGNAVTVNGVPATVSSWSANTLVVVAPSLRTLGSSTALVADVAVKDLSTGGTTVMSQALSYAAPVTTLSLLTAPTGTVILAQPAAIPLVVQVLKGDGVTPVEGEAVTFSATTGSVQFAACGGATCTVSTNAQGIASTIVTPESAGAITLNAAGIDGTVSASFTALARIQTASAVQATEYVAAGATVAWSPQLAVADNFASTLGVVVAWQTISGAVTASPSQSQVDSQGVASTVATSGPLAAGSQALLSGCAWTTVCATFTVRGVDPAEFQLVAISGAGQSVSASGTLSPVVVEVVDKQLHPVAGAVVQVYQTVDAWQPPCPDRGRCPIPPVLASLQSTATSDAYGMVTITPLQLPGLPGVTNVAAASGTEGFVSLTLQKQP